MHKKEKNNVQEFNSLYKELDDMYHEIALQIGVSDCVLTIFYTICRMGGGCLRRDVCEQAYVSKTTVNSAIRKMEKLGYLYLEQGRGHDKHIYLTEKGHTFSVEYVCPLIQTEECAFAALEEQEQEMLTVLVRKYVINFRSQKKENYQ